MEIALLAVLFLVGAIWGGMQALTWLDRRRQRDRNNSKNDGNG